VAFDFPASPSVGQSFTPPGGFPIYIWDGQKWNAFTAVSGPDPPFDPYGLQLNGGMEVSQEKGATATALVPAGAYIVDGWKGFRVGTSVVNGAQFAGSAGFLNQMILTVATAQASMTAPDFVGVIQYIEGLRAARLAWGGSNAVPITLSFWTAHHRTGTYTGTIRNSATNRSYAFTYTQNVPDVPEYKTVTISGDTSGTWLTDTGIGLQISFAMACGATNTAPSNNGWLAGNYLAGQGQINGVAATSDLFRITCVAVTPGSVAPTAAQSPLLMRPYDVELQACKRYWEEARAYWTGQTVTSGSYYVFVPYAADKRIVAALTSTQTGAGNGGFGTRSSAAATIRGFEWSGIASGAVNGGGYSDRVFADARF
jgi:hypothetical protein